MKKVLFCLFIGAMMFFHSCTPIKTSPQDEKHQAELTLHELQINVDDFHHDLNCFKTDLKIIESKIKSQEKQLEGVKSHQLVSYQSKIEAMGKTISKLEKDLALFDKKQKQQLENVEKLVSYEKKVDVVLNQYKDKLVQLEKTCHLHQQKLSDVGKLRKTLEVIADSLKLDTHSFIMYNVQPGDSLERIAKKNNTTVEQLKRVNELKQDLIVIDQKLKIPR